MKKLIPLVLAAASLSAERYQETLYPEWGQSFEIGKMIHQEKSEYWDLAIFENPLFGRVFAIDGVIQTTEKDEAFYHEIMSHVPLMAHENPVSVLIIGAGDGGVLREVLRHETVQKAVMVEIDPAVIELSKKHLPEWSNGAFDDPRAKIVIQDASKFVKETEEMFDVIICDSNDPEGPAKVLFSPEFYGDCKKRLNPKGIFVNQNGVPLLQEKELQLTLENRKPHFKYVTYYVAPVPTYVGGYMALGWASDTFYKPSERKLAARMEKVRGKLRYYTPAVHKASFALPQYVLDALN